ncbi:DUF397 domain-containing protein [Kitasatospora sp. NPDC101157]|uniref:DUF397 domain-containing protein n=1 Tax=Kitasatospora sp. NPDC101157 TaxID=3364098 RepID=UPI0038233957
MGTPGGGEGRDQVASSPSAVHVRDSKDKAGPTLTFSPEAWAAFVAFAPDAQVATVEWPLS